MRKLLIAAVLGGVATVPAQASVFVELQGHAVVGTTSVYDLTFTPLRQSSLLISGYCTQGACSLSFGDSRFTLFYGASGGSYTINFVFDPYQQQYNDGDWHDGSGSGRSIFYGGGDHYEEARFTFDSARIAGDNELIQSNTGPAFYYGKFYSVPEPATWAMMIGGFALAGAALRRKRYRVAFA